MEIKTQFRLVVRTYQFKDSSNLPSWVVRFPLNYSQEDTFMNVSVKLTIFFEEPFWVGVFERGEEKFLSVSKIVFGAEPKDYEVYEFVLKEYYNLKFSKPVLVDEYEKRKINPKRFRKKINEETKNAGIGTKAQLAMKQQYEDNKKERKKISRDEKEQEKERQFELRQQKKKEKHKGH